MIKIVLYVIIVLLFSGCINAPKVPHNSKALEQSILSIDKTIDKNEALKFSYKILEYSSSLEDKYKLQSPPLYHNFLVNSGFKQRGLCWHFAQDMLNFILDQKFKSFDYYIVGANINNYWDEHNAIVITCKGCSYKKGIVLDAWRNSGKLYYSKIEDDSEYKWSNRGYKIDSKLIFRGALK